MYKTLEVPPLCDSQDSGGSLRSPGPLRGCPAGVRHLFRASRPTPGPQDSACLCVACASVLGVKGRVLFFGYTVSLSQGALSARRPGCSELFRNWVFFAPVGQASTPDAWRVRVSVCRLSI